MLAMETKSQTNGVANSLPLNSGGGSQNPQDPASESQARQQLLSQNILNNIGNSGIQGPVALSSALPSGANLTQSSMPNAINQGSNMHSRMAQNSSGNLVGQGGLASNMLANSTRKMQGYQLPQQTGSQQQQSQSSQKILHQQQHLLKQKQQLQHLPGNVPSSIMQSRMQQQQPQQQQQNPMQSTKLQSTQQPHMQIGLQPSQSALQQTQPSMMQSSSGLHQNPQSSVAQTTPNVRQQYPQSVLRKPQQQAQRSRHQQAPVLHQQQHLVLPLQQQINVPNLPSRQQNNVSNMQQQQQQHKQGLLEHQNNIANMQQHLLGNNIPLQQQLSQQSNTSGSQKQHQQPMHTVHQQRENMQKQQNAQVSTNLLQIQEQHAQSQPALQQLMLQHPSQTTQMHQKLGLQQQPNSLQTDMQPKIQTSTGSMLNHQSLLDQKPVFHSQRPPPEDSSAAIDAAITGNATTTGNVVDVQEEVYQKIKFMREKYLPDLSHMHQKISQKCQQHDSLPQPPKSEQLERLKAFKNSLEKIMGFLNLPKSMMIPSLKDKTSGVSSQSNTGNIGHVHNTAYLGEVQSPAIGTPGISASPLIEEFTGPNGNQVTSSTITKPSVTEQPIERLMKAVNSISPKAFSASVSDIGSVISMIDWIAGSAPGNGSKSAVGEDLVAMARCRIQAKNLIQQDGSSARKKMRRHTVAVPLNAMSSAGSMNDNFKQLVSMELSDIESTATTRMKRSRDEAIHVLLEEIGKINQRLIDTVVDISDEDVRSIAATGAAEGTIVKCSYNAVAVSRNLKALYASAQMTPIQPLRLLVPTNYPNCSPILLDRFPVEPSKEHEDLSTKVKSRFGRSLRSLSQPMSLHDMVKTWDVCVRAVISDYACPRGGSFSSRCGAWENCPSAIDLIS
ncbi:hypothetical protein C5167_018078 [Papaver somniferum]|uniref:ARC105/Med15 mediator subunit C-terminal domain-containing protein n=1 Tax=Papaver somniferum TaxID=3469 RepID=A0A4Y7IPN5_PAPSO|nr:hypothetical protein C5167_018078 [Papaver somniferum]